MSTKERKNITAQELYYLLKRNSEGGIEARNRLAELYIDLSFRVSKERFIKNPTVDEQEIVSASFLGLMRGIDTYDIDSNLGYTEYLTKNIAMSIDAAIKEKSKEEKTVSIEEIKKHESSISDGKPDMCSEMNRKNVIRAIKAIIEGFNPNERLILELYFGFVGDRAFGTDDIAMKMNLPLECVDKTIEGCLNTLRSKIVEVAEGRFASEIELDEDALNSGKTM